MSTTYYGVRIGATDSVMYLCARHARPYGGARIPMTDPTNRRCQECRAPLSKRPARRRDERMLRAGAGESDAERDAAETALAATEKE